MVDVVGARRGVVELRDRVEVGKAGLKGGNDLGER
jgi:hypothetical protein